MVGSEAATDPRRSSGKDEERNPNEETGDVRKDTATRKANKERVIVGTI
jgi:hypothetical protein